MEKNNNLSNAKEKLLQVAELSNLPIYGFNFKELSKHKSSLMPRYNKNVSFEDMVIFDRNGDAYTFEYTPSTGTVRLFINNINFEKQIGRRPCGGFN